MLLRLRMPYFLVLISHVRTSQAYAYAYACAYRTSGNQALGNLWESSAAIGNRGICILGNYEDESPTHVTCDKSGQAWMCKGSVWCISFVASGNMIRECTFGKLYLY